MTARLAFSVLIIYKKKSQLRLLRFCIRWSLTPLKRLTVRTIIPFIRIILWFFLFSEKKTRISSVTLHSQDVNNQKLANKVTRKTQEKGAKPYIFIFKLFRSFQQPFRLLFCFVFLILFINIITRGIVLSYCCKNIDDFARSSVFFLNIGLARVRDTRLD